MKYDVRLMKVVEGKLEEVPESDFDKEHYEEQVENWIEQKPEILAENLMIIDRQLRTEEGEKPDLLAIDDEGNLVILEVKNEKASRDVIAQVLDYASSMSKLKEENIEVIVRSYYEVKHKDKEFVNLRDTCERFFGNADLDFNTKQRMIIVAPGLDASISRIIDFLAMYGIDIKAVTFGFHKDKLSEYITRGIIQPEVVKIERESLERFFDTPDHLKGLLKDIKSFVEENSCYFHRPRGSEASFYSARHRHRVGVLQKQAKAVVVSLHPMYYKLEDIGRMKNFSNCKLWPSKDRETEKGGEIIDWMEFKRLVRSEDFEKIKDEILRAMKSLDEYYGNPSITAHWKKKESLEEEQ